ncbi:MAG: T9SS type A sorting domain-containing protein [Bacteroidota bacterium]
MKTNRTLNIRSGFLSPLWLIHKAFLVLAAMVITCFAAYSAESTQPMQVQISTVKSSYYNGNGTTYSTPYTTRVSNSGVPWIHLHFNNVNLGTSSYIELHGKSAKSLILDGISLSKQNNFSGFFNGDYIDVTIYVAPNDTNIHLEVDKVFSGQSPSGSDDERCDPSKDFRVPTTTPAPGVCRLTWFYLNGVAIGNGTAFYTNYGLLVTAGHNIYYAQQKNADYMSVQFNVPLSDKDGIAQHPDDPNDEYFVQLKNFPAGNWEFNGLGADWAIFSVIMKPNQPPIGNHGSIVISESINPPEPVTAIGYGFDNRYYPMYASRTQQKSTGSLTLINRTSGSIWFNAYVASGCSGGPILNSDNQAIGIITDECEVGTDYIGTSFLYQRLNDIFFSSTNEVTVDQSVYAQDRSNILQRGVQQGNTFVTVHVGKITKWNGTGWDQPVSADPPPSWQYDQSTTSVIFQADPNAIPVNTPYYKFNIWSDDAGYQNTLIGGFNPRLGIKYSRFIPVATNVTLKAQLQTTTDTYDGGYIELKDPWLNDLKDATNTKVNNRGMDAVFNPISYNPIDIDHAADENGNLYKGVFVHQGNKDNLLPPYYTIRAPLTQYVHDGIKQFDRWDVTGADIIDIGVNTPGFDTKAVVFNTEGATVTAVYKSITSVPTTVSNRWNMLSVPVKEVNFSRNAVFANALPGDANLVTWSGQIYVSPQTLDNRVGYWVNYPSTPSSQNVTYSGIAQDSFHIAVKTGWNMIGSLYQDINRSKISASGTAFSSNFFGFNAGYVMTDVIQAGKGYWIKVNQDGQLFMDKNSTGSGGTLACTPQPSNPMGAPPVPAPFSPSNGSSGVSTIPTLTWTASTGATSYHLQVATDLCFTSIFYDSPGLTTTSEQIDPCSYSTTYYWRVNATNGVTSIWSDIYSFTVQSNGGGGCLASSMVSLDQFIVTDAAGNSQQMYAVNGGRTLNLGFTDFDMPPVTPRGIFHARFKSGKFIEKIMPNRGQSRIPISIKDVKYPVTIHWKLQGENAASYWLNEPGSGKNQIPMTGSGSMALSNTGSDGIVIIASAINPCLPAKTISKFIDDGVTSATPATYLLHQNMPNPFNPTTMINYELPEAGHVTLKVYNMLGQEVATLVDEVQDAGYRTARFDGNNVSSGVYFYRLVAGGFSDFKKMILVK